MEPKPFGSEPEDAKAFRLAFDRSPLAMWVVDEETSRIIHVNDAACRNYGYTRKEFLALGDHDLRVTRGDPERHLLKDGSAIDVKVWSSEIQHAGRGLRFDCAVDITQRLAAQRALRAKDAGLRRAQHMARLSHVITGLDGVFEEWSDTFPLLAGLPAQSMPRDTRAWMALVHPDDRQRFRTASLRAARTGRRELVDYRLAQGGEWVHVRQVMEPLDSVAGPVPRRWFNTLLDVSEQKRAEEEMQRLNVQLEQRVAERTAELEHANKDLESFTSWVSHDLRAPARVITGFAEVLMAEHAGSMPTGAMRLLGRIHSRASLMGPLIDDLLSLSFAGTRPLLRTRVDLGEVVAECIEELGEEIASRKIEVKVGPLPTARADRALIAIVMRNLLRNAFKYTRHRRLATVEIGSETIEGETVISVRDNGVGFDMKHAKKLFEAFQRLHSEAEFEGSGIGLAIVERIVRRHGGWIRGAGEVGEGATFRFTLAGEEGESGSPEGRILGGSGWSNEVRQ